jgi:regulator of replication initiation timing
MILNGNQKVGEAEVFATAREMEMQKQIESLAGENNKLKKENEEMRFRLESLDK